MLTAFNINSFKLTLATSLILIVSTEAIGKTKNKIASSKKYSLETGFGLGQLDYSQKADINAQNISQANIEKKINASYIYALKSNLNLQIEANITIGEFYSGELTVDDSSYIAFEPTIKFAYTFYFQRFKNRKEPLSSLLFGRNSDHLVFFDLTSRFLPYLSQVEFESFEFNQSNDLLFTVGYKMRRYFSLFAIEFAPALILAGFSSENDSSRDYFGVSVDFAILRDVKILGNKIRIKGKFNFSDLKKTLLVKDEVYGGEIETDANYKRSEFSLNIEKRF